MPKFSRVASLMIYGKGRSVIVVEGLRINFKVVKTKDEALNTAKIEVYNLSKETRESFSALNSKVLLKVGYNNEDVSDVFRGDIVRVYTIKKPPEVITVIDALDGRKETVTKISVGYPPGTTSKSILQDLSELVGFEGSDISSENKTYKNGFSFSGLTKDILTKVAKFMGADWSVQNGHLKCVSQGQSDKKRINVLSAETGLLDSPVKIGSIDPTKNSKAVDGWKIRCLLLPSLEPGNRVVIKSEMLSSEVLQLLLLSIPETTLGITGETILEVEEMKGKAVQSPVEAKFK